MDISKGVIKSKRPLTLVDVENELLSVVIESNGHPCFLTGYDSDLSWFSDPSKEDGIFICQQAIAEWQRALDYFQRKE